MAHTEELALGRTPGTREYDSIVRSISGFPRKLGKKLLWLPVYILCTALFILAVPLFLMFDLAGVGNDLNEDSNESIVKQSMEGIWEIVVGGWYIWEELLFYWGD